MTWKPIETAPKDGSYVLLGHPKWQVVWQGYYRTGREPGMNEHLTDERVRGWTRTGFQDFQLPATHWMPLPAPPVEG